MQLKFYFNSYIKINTYAMYAYKKRRYTQIAARDNCDKYKNIDLVKNFIFF